MEHDEEIHAATLSVHGWFHDQVVQGFHEEVEYYLIEEPPFEEVPQLAAAV
jgi:hypothetical protein